MGRPRELSPDERAELLRQGYRPVEVWVPDMENEEVIRRLLDEASRVAKADERDDVTGWIKGTGPTDWDKP